MQIFLKRVYEPAEPGDGYRVLIDRLWPRGLKKENIKIDLWFKEIAPSNELRKWFNHDQARWKEFKQRYIQELNKNKILIADFLSVCDSDSITLVYSSKDVKHNQAVVIKAYIEQIIQGQMEQ